MLNKFVASEIDTIVLALVAIFVHPLIVQEASFIVRYQISARTESEKDYFCSTLVLMIAGLS